MPSSHGRKGKKWSDISKVISCRNPSCGKRFGIGDGEDEESVLKKHSSYFAECAQFCFGEEIDSENGDSNEIIYNEDTAHAGIEESYDDVDVGLVDEDGNISKRLPEVISDDIIEIQKAIDDMGMSKENLRMRSKHRDEINTDLELEDLFKIYTFGFNVGVSAKEGNDLLALINELLAKYKANAQSPVKTWEAVRNIVKRGTKQFDVKRPFVMELPELYFGKCDIQKPDIKLDKVYGQFFDIKFKLAKYFMQIKPEQLVQKRNVKVDEDGDVLLEGFSSGDIFERFSNHKFEVPLAYEGHEAVGDPIHICLNISFDKAQVSMNNSMALFPVSFNVLNVVGDESFFQLMGYCPMNLPYDDVTLCRLMTENGILAKSKQTDIIRRVKSSIINHYILECFGPVLRQGNKCFYVYVGSGDTRVMKAVMFHVGCFTGDGAGLVDITFTHWMSFEGKSRMHTDQRSYRFIRDEGEIAEFRDSSQHAQLLLELQTLFNLKILAAKATPRKQFRHLTESESNATKLATELGVKDMGGELFLKKLFEYEDEWGLHDFYKAVPCDLLHVVNLGVIKDFIQNTVTIFECIGKLDKQYASNVGILDRRLQHFPFTQSFSPMVEHSFQFNVAMGTTHDTVISRVKEASWFPPLLMQFMFSVGSDGVLIPNDSVLLEEKRIPDPRLRNPTLLILNACVSLFYAVVSLNSPKMWYSETETLQYLCSNSLYWLMLVKQLCKTLSSPVTKQRLASNGKVVTKKVYRIPDPKEWNPGEKLLYFREYAVQKRSYGADNRTYDTQASEGLHKLIINPIISRTSKRSSSMLKECSEIVEMGEFMDLVDNVFKKQRFEHDVLSSTDYDYPYVPSNSKVQEVTLRLNTNGVLMSCSVSDHSQLHVLVNMNTLGRDVIRLLSSFAVDLEKVWTYKVLSHESISVLGSDNEAIKMAYRNSCGKNCCGVMFNVFDPITGQIGEAIGRVCGVIEVTWVDRDEVQHSVYKVIVAPLQETIDDDSYLPFPLYRYKVSRHLVTKMQLIQPDSIVSGLTLIPYLKSNAIFDTYTDVQSMQFYVIYKDTCKFGVESKKTISSYIDNRYDQSVDDRRKCFLTENYLRLEQELLDLNERKTRKQDDA